jgi:hypothetical protein
MRRAEVKINGTSVRFPPTRNWKRIVSAEVAEQLHAGTNVIETRVFNHNGPPVLWLTLTADRLRLRSDKSWEVSLAGSSWRHAALGSWAKTPRPGNSRAGGARTFDALKKLWPLWIVMIVIVGGGALLWRVLFKKCTTTRLERVLLFVFAALWSLLFWNNARLLPFNAGFDSTEHLQYISYIQEHRALPLPTEGWEMYQPPLYYLIAAAKPYRMQTVHWRFGVDLRTPFAGAIIWNRAIRVGVFQFAIPVSCTDRVRRTLTGSLSADAIVPGALRNERNAGCHAGDRDALSLFASA